MNEIFIDVIESNGNIVNESFHNTTSFLWCNIYGVKFEWWNNTSRIVLGYGNSHEDREILYQDIEELINETSKLKKKKLLNSYTSFYLIEDICEIDFQNILQKINHYLVENSDVWSKPFGNITLETKVEGITFEGTIFKNLKERGTTMSPMFGSIVCKASGMKLERMLCEYYIQYGRIDGVELDEEGNLISIYECGSGIHKGNCLDWDHWNKVLCRYLYSPEVNTDHLQKLVILAGAYEKEMIEMYPRVKSLLDKANIEFILLKTIRENNRIDVCKV